MKIGFDAKRAFFNQSGLGNYSRTLISGLCKLFPENEYFLFTPRENKIAAGFPPKNSRIIKPSSFPFEQLPSIWRTFFMGKEISNHKIQLFHGLSNELPLDIKKHNVRSVVTIHDLIFLRYPDLYKITDRTIYLQKFRQSCRLADVIVAVSEQTKSDIIHYFSINPDKIKVIYQSCSPLYYAKAGETAKNVVRNKYFLPPNYMLYVGTIEERKNLLQIIKARHENDITLPLVVIGRKTTYFEKVSDYIIQNNISGIIFLKNIPQEELPAIYQMAEIFLYPSSFEGFGIPILEAMNSGIPVIAGKGSCMEETGGLHSIYVNPSQSDEIGESIKKIIYNPAIKTKMVQEGYKQAMLFREVQTTGEMMKLYQKLLYDAGGY